MYKKAPAGKPGLGETNCQESIQAGLRKEFVLVAFRHLDRSKQRQRLRCWMPHGGQVSDLSSIGHNMQWKSFSVSCVNSACSIAGALWP
jgi:hypothetical protein